MSDFLDEAMEEEAKAGPPQTVFTEVSRYAQSLDALDVEIEKKEQELSDLKKQRETLASVTLPTLMQANRIDGITLDNGRKLAMDTKVSIRVPKNEEGKNRVLQFLYDHGAGDLIKDSLTVEDAPESLKMQLVENDIAFESKRDVNTNSLVAWTKGVLGLKKGSMQTIRKDDFPKEANLFIYNEATISKPSK